MYFFRKCFLKKKPLIYSSFIQHNNNSSVVKKGIELVGKEVPSYLSGDDSTVHEVARHMAVFENFLSIAEEDSLLTELEPYLKRLRYEYDHWDNAIHGFRETEKAKWNEKNQVILEKVHQAAFAQGSTTRLQHIHVLDLAKNGYIKPHVDSVRFCGDTIAGLSLISSSVMRLANEKRKNLQVDVLLQRRSLYIMRGPARYNYTHELLVEGESFFKGMPIPRERRISVICRNEPPDDS